VNAIKAVVHETTSAKGALVTQPHNKNISFLVLLVTLILYTQPSIYDKYCILGCDTVYVRNLQMFQANELTLFVKMDAAHSSETCVNLYQTIRHHLPEVSVLHTHRRENTNVRGRSPDLKKVSLL